MISWYPGLEKLEIEDIEIDTMSATCKCVGCKDNRDGFCDRNKKWAHMLTSCYPETKVVQKFERIVGLVAIYKRSGSYYYKFNKNTKVYLSKALKSEEEALKELAKIEKRLYGRRQRNLHVEV